MSNNLSSKVTLTLLTLLVGGALTTAGWHVTKYYLKTKKEATSTQTNSQNETETRTQGSLSQDVPTQNVNEQLDMLYLKNLSDEVELVTDSDGQRDFKKLFSNL